jgi:hypothetical protein
MTVYVVIDVNGKPESLHATYVHAMWAAGDPRYVLEFEVDA